MPISSIRPLREEMAATSNSCIRRGDVADWQPGEGFTEVKGQGRLFKMTSGLQTEFGGQTAGFNAPMAESLHRPGPGERPSWRWLGGMQTGSSRFSFHDSGGDDAVAGYELRRPFAGASNNPFSALLSIARADGGLFRRRTPCITASRGEVTSSTFPGCGWDSFQCEDACGMIANSNTLR